MRAIFVMAPAVRFELTYQWLTANSITNYGILVYVYIKFYGALYEN